MLYQDQMGAIIIMAFIKRKKAGYNQLPKQADLGRIVVTNVIQVS